MMNKLKNRIGRSVWRWPILLALLLTVFSVAPILAQSGGNYDVEWQVIGAAGDEFASGGSYQVGFTLAQDQEPLVSSGGGYQIAQGYWSGAGFLPTAVTLAGFWIESRGDTLVAVWETASEVELLGFNLYRSESGESGTFQQLNPGLIPAQGGGSPGGAYYEWVDVDVVVGPTYWYLLEGVDIHGGTTEFGPVEGMLLQPQIFLPLMLKF